MEALAAKAGLTYKGIIENRLCKSSLSNLRLAEVATKLTSYSTTDIQAFLGDISVSSCGGNTYICGNINNLTVGLIEAWKIENEAVITSTRKLNRDWKTLTTIRDIQTNEATTLQSLLSVSGLSGGLKTILQAYAVADCPTCGNPVTYGIPDLAEVWINAKYMLNLHNQNVLGARNLITGSSLFHPATTGFGFGAKSGANHMIKDIRSRMWGATNIAALDQGLPTTSKRFDLQKSNEAGFVEYKSYSEDYGIGDVAGIGSGSWKDFDQFLAYLKQPQVRDMGGTTLEYVFDAKKIPNVSDIKDAFQKMMLTKDAQNNPILTMQGTQVFETIWANTTLRGNLFPRGEYPQEYDEDQYEDAAKATFQRLINSLDNKLYGFIKVK